MLVTLTFLAEKLDLGTTLIRKLIKLMTYTLTRTFSFSGFVTISPIFSSFIPIHFGAERDLRFVYCAGESLFDFTYFLWLILL